MEKKRKEREEKERGERREERGERREERGERREERGERRRRREGGEEGGKGVIYFVVRISYSDVPLLRGVSEKKGR